MVKRIMQVVPSEKSVWADLMESVAAEASRFCSLAQSRGLSPVESKQLAETVKSLNLLSLQAARQRAQDTIANLPDADIWAALVELLKEHPELRQLLGPKEPTPETPQE